jgi:hypothetical protein
MNDKHSRQLARLATLSKAEKGILAAELCAEALLAVRNLQTFIAGSAGSNENWGMLLNTSKLFTTPQQRQLLAIVNAED